MIQKYLCHQQFRVHWATLIKRIERRRQWNSRKFLFSLLFSFTCLWSCIGNQLAGFLGNWYIFRSVRCWLTIRKWEETRETSTYQLAIWKWWMQKKMSQFSKYFRIWWLLCYVVQDKAKIKVATFFVNDILCGTRKNRYRSFIKTQLANQQQKK